MIITVLIVSAFIIIKNKVLNKAYKMIKAMIRKSVNKFDDKVIAAIEAITPQTR